MGNKLRPSVILLLAASFSVFTYMHALTKAARENSFYDFGYYWKNASLLLSGYDVWERKAQPHFITENVDGSDLRIRIISPWHSSGFFAVILPFAFLPFKTASWLWLAIGHIAFFLAIWFMLKMADLDKNKEDVCSVLFLVFSFWPLREQLYMMQPNFLIILFMALAFYLIERRLFWSGFMLGLAMNLREYLFVFCLFFIWKRIWRGLAGMLLGFLGLKAAGMFLFGWDKELSYLRFIKGSFLERVNLSIDNHSLTAFLSRLGEGFIGSKTGLWLGVFMTGLFVVLSLYAARGKRLDLRLGLSLFSALIFLISPWVHECHYIVLYPAIITVWLYVRKSANIRLDWVFILTYLLLGLKYSLNRFPQFYRGEPHIFMGGKLYGVILLFGIIFYLMIKSGDYEKDRSRTA